MKWFHHECAAKYSPRLAELGANLGLAGFGLYWNLLEEIGFQSDTLLVKITGMMPEADQRFNELVRTGDRTDSFTFDVDPAEIPVISEKVLARKTFGTTGDLAAMIPEFVRLGLFDGISWQTYGILFSAGFVRRADDYTRRHKVLTVQNRHSRGQSTDRVKTKSDKVLPEQNRREENSIEDDSEEENCREENRAEEEKSEGNRSEQEKTKENRSREVICATDELKWEDESLSEQELQAGLMEVKQILLAWNSTHSSKCDWIPNEFEFKKLLSGRSPEFRRSQCFDAMDIIGPDVTYTQIVCRAVRLMLDQSSHTRIANPFRWVYAALCGGKGVDAWVLTMTPKEEAAGYAARRRRAAGPESVTAVAMRGSSGKRLQAGPLSFGRIQSHLPRG